jgi:hypothetical protein
MTVLSPMCHSFLQYIQTSPRDSAFTRQRTLQSTRFPVYKLITYKVILKPIWTYGIQLWGSASISSIEILERFPGKVLRMITDAPWYVPNMVLRQDLQITSVKVEIHRFRDRLYTHPKNLTVHLTVPPDQKRLRRHLPVDLPTRLNV